MKQEVKRICVKDVMTKLVITVDASVSIHEAAKMMKDKKVGSVVVTQNNTPVGIITDRDYAIKIAANAYPISTPVKKVMSTPLYSISPEESAWMIADYMDTLGIRKVPVIDNDKVVGIVTATDLVNQFANCTEEEMKKMYYQSLERIYEQYDQIK